MRLACEHAAAGAGGPFGAVIALRGEIVGEGWNKVTSTNDPTAHAEMVAIRSATRRLGRFDLRGATLYTSCEPCPMCLGAAYWARLDRVLWAATREQAAAAGFDDAFIYDEVPKPPGARALPMGHLPLDTGDDPFAIWLAKADRIRY